MIIFGLIAIWTIGAFIIYQTFDTARYLVWLYKTEKEYYERNLQQMPILQKP
jgi:hypothetical protein